MTQAVGDFWFWHGTDQQLVEQKARLKAGLFVH
jgi:hypothetical protein